WKCRRKHAKPVDKIGTQFKCSCDYDLRVPTKDDGNCRIKTVGDYVIEAVLCGGGGALLGFLLGAVIVSRIWLFDYWISVWLIAILTISFGLVGFVGGERAIDVIGDMIRRQEQE